MIAGLPVTFQSFWFLVIAVAMTVAAVLVVSARRRRPGLPRLSALLALLGMLCLAVAAGQPVWHRPQRHTVGVMVDLSPSTRGALFRDPQQVKKRLQELIGDTPYRVFGFARNIRPIPADGPWPEFPAPETRFNPVAADAVVLFSDCQFRVPASGPPTFIVVDPGLENVSDARVDHVEVHGSSMSATVVNSGGPRQAIFRTSSQPTTAPVGSGQTIITRPIGADAKVASVELNSGDLWPENDILQVRNTAPMASERWWIGDNPPSSGWVHFSPQDFPLDPGRLPGAAVIVLNNVDFPSLGRVAVDRINDYVNDLDGSLLIIGGDHAYSRGDYGATYLERLSPLSLWPPNLVTRWIILIDSSGSMAQTVGGMTRFELASRGALQILPYMSSGDVVDIGQFSGSVHWWYPELTTIKLVLYGFRQQYFQPRGPTDLEDALNKAADKADAGNIDQNVSSKVLLLSDCDASISDPQSIIDSFKRLNISLNVLAIGQGSGIKAVQQIAQATGGSVQEQFDPQKWFTSTRDLVVPQSFFFTPRSLQFIGTAQALGSETTSQWHRMWLKSRADPLAQSDGADGMPMAASWRLGFGHIAATAYQPSTEKIVALANLVAHPPRDPRFTVKWELGKVNRVIVDAVDHGEFMDDLKLTLVVPGGSDALKWDIPQTAPGRYEVDMPSSQGPTLMGVEGDNGLIDTIAVASRYAPEFESLGNNHDSMRLVADRTGGQVIEMDNHNPIDFHWPQRDVDLAPLLCTGAAGLLAIAIIRWRLA